MALKFWSMLLVCFLFTKMRAAKNVGDWTNANHGVRGSISYVTTTSIVLNNFYYDGSGPDVFLYYYPVGSPVAQGEGTIIMFAGAASNGKFNRGYNNEQVQANLPDGATACNVAGFSIWCRQFGVSFGQIVVDRGAAVDNAQGECHLKNASTVVVSTTKYDNCIPLSSSLRLRWKVDNASSEIDFEICGCRSSGSSTINNYMGFGLSGVETRTHMIGSDATIAWVDVSTGRANAVDYHLTGRFQCRAGEGVCPDTFLTRLSIGCVDNVRSVSGGIRDTAETCVSYSRPFQTNDSVCDKIFTINEDQYIVWAVGNLGETAFIHSSRSPAETAPVRFGRTPKDECNATITCAECSPFAGSEIDLTKSATLRVSIGPSALGRGYSAITGQASWGIAWYINDQLVPKLILRRGVTYTFLIEGGNNPEILSQYHPFYLTNSKIGGRLRNTQEQQREEVVYAGFNAAGNPTGVGRLCERQESPAARTARVTCASKEDYIRKVLATTPDCKTGQPGTLVWTPDKKTPDIVYYQCATHQNLGWKILVKDSQRQVTSTTYLSITMAVLLNIVGV